MVVPFGCIHSIAEQSITAQIPNWLKEKLLKKKNSTLLLTGFFRGKPVIIARISLS